MDEDGAQQGPGEEGGAPHRDGRVHADQHAAAQEGGRPLEHPAPVLDGEEGAVGMPAPDVEPGEDVPVVEDAHGVVGRHALHERREERVRQRAELLHRLRGACADGVHRADGHGRGGR